MTCWWAVAGGFVFGDGDFNGWEGGGREGGGLLKQKVHPSQCTVQYC